ncbi:GlxA family transcriptional regulator [Streptomyces chiangmaiensis]|uniref:Helix-turn-helix domain-containing protein n=1 Tax=Streptomyces chiangmaiensis TaxID=766497 RepID=A0ABU7FUM9_9ACTN|nr:helix-turn-helix domain-containing protein [Streptomyces chiangmaiensis]MED7827528.1 helix-turn-helix domain-containing protein [Streptomyces chiangmaiensis]
MPYRTAPLTVAILVTPRVIALDFSIPAHILGGYDGYRVFVCSETADATTETDFGGHRALPVGAASGITPTHSLATAETADIVVVPGFEDPEIPIPEPYLDTLSRCADRGTRIAAICTGAFALAASGILNGKNVTTHWQYTSRLRRLFPAVKVLDNRVFVEDGNILTSAGGGAGIDACLHIIRTDYGAAAAHESGKEVVAAPVRSSEHHQYADVQTPPATSLSATRAWTMENIAEPITVQHMADHSNLPRRTFIRHFRTETGMPPMRWVTLQRILTARRLLERTDLSVEKIADATGFGTASNLRTHFKRELGTTPTVYRRTASGA